MTVYLIKRLLGLLPTLLIVAVLVFLFVHLLPGDPAYGQLRIVGYRGTDADNDRIDQSPQSVEVGQSGRPIDVF